MTLEQVMYLVNDRDRTARRFGFDEAETFESEIVKKAILEFAAAQVAAEREACAKLCDSKIDPEATYQDQLFNNGVTACADAIRARSNIKGEAASGIKT